MTGRAALHRPTFLVLGAAKAGTTSLHYYLSQHPEVCVSDPKEPPFFQVEYERGLDWYWRTYYRHYAGQRHAGEAAHQNLRLPYVTRRIAESLPEARLFVVCRDPVERAFSAWWYNAMRGWERRSFEEAIEENRERLRSGPRFEDEREATLYAESLISPGSSGQIRYASYLDSGYYAAHIERFARAVGPDRLEVLFFEDLVRDAGGTMGRVFAGLGLAPVPLADASAQNRPVSPLAGRLFRRLAAAPGVRRVPMEWRLRFKKVVGSLMRSAKPEMDPQTRRALIEHFRPHNQALSRLTGRDLSHWSDPGSREPAAVGAADGEGTA